MRSSYCTSKAPVIRYGFCLLVPLLINAACPQLPPSTEEDQIVLVVENPVTPGESELILVEGNTVKLSAEGAKPSRGDVLVNTSEGGFRWHILSDDPQ